MEQNIHSSNKINKVQSLDNVLEILNNSKKRLTLIQQNNPKLYELLANLKIGLKCDISQISGHIVEQHKDIKCKYSSQTYRQTICNKRMTYYYVCKSCHQDTNDKICQECFDLQYHKQHNYITEACFNGYCQCGLTNFMDKKCPKNHNSAHKYCKPSIPNLQLQQLSTKSELLMHLVSVAQLLSISLQVKIFNQNNLKQIFQQLLKFNQNDVFYNIFTTYCFSLRIRDSNSASIVEKLWSLNDKYFPDCTQSLFTLLCNQHAYVYLFLQSIKHSRTILKINKLLMKLKESPVILSQMAKNNKINSYIWDYDKMLGEFLEKMRNRALPLKKAAQYILPIVKCEITNLGLEKFFKKHIIGQRLHKYVQYHQYLLQIISVDTQLLQQLIFFELQHKVYKQQSSKKSNRWWYNHRINVILTSVRGNMQDFLKFFSKFKAITIQNLFNNYFMELFVSNRKGKFNRLTTICLYRLAKHHELQLSIEQQSSNSKMIKLNRIHKNLSILIRNLLTNQKYINIQLFKIYKNVQQLNQGQIQGKQGNQSNKIIVDQINKYRQMVFDEVENYLSTMKTMSEYKIAKINNQLSKDMGVQNCQLFLTKIMVYNQSKKLFQYTGKKTQQKQLHYSIISQIDSLLKQNNSQTETSESEIKPNLTIGELRQFLQLYVLAPLKMKAVNFQMFASYSIEDKSRILLNLIYLDRIFDGKKQFVSQSLKNVISLNRKIKKKNPIIQGILKQFSLTQSLNINQNQKVKQKSQQEDPVLLQQKVQQIKQQQVMVKSESTVFIQNNLPEIAELNNENTSVSLIELQPNKQQMQQKQLSAKQIQVLQQRKQKMNKIKQKYKRKSNKYNYHVQTHPEKQQQVCLICREISAKHHQKSFMFYLGALKSDQLTQLIYGLKGNQLTLSCCFHPFHLKCFHNNHSNGNFTICTLCKFNGNFLLPAINNTMQSLLFVKTWWLDFINIKSFTPKENKPSYGGYYSNYLRPVVLVKQSTNKGEEPICQQNNQRPYKNFIMIYRCLAMRISSFASKSQWSVSYQKNLYFYQLMKIFYDHLSIDQRKLLKLQIQQYQELIKKSVFSQFVIEATLIGSKALTIKLEGLQQNADLCEAVKTRCKSIQKKYPQNLYNKFMKNIEWLLDCKIGKQQDQQQQKIKKQQDIKSVSTGGTILNNQLIKYLFSLEIPQNAQKLYHMRVRCKKCEQLITYLCLFCKNKYCRNCQNVSLHCKQNHNNHSILALFFDQGVLATVSGNVVKETKIYFNYFRQEFNSSVLDRLSSYQCSYDKVNDMVQGIFKQYF